MLATNTVFWIRADSVEGRIIGHEYMERAPGQRLPRFEGVPARATVVSFRTRAGQEIVFATDWGSDLEVYSVGESVTVLYDRDDPDDAKIRGFVSLYLGPLMLLGFGGVCWFVGMMLKLFGADRPRAGE